MKRGSKMKVKMSSAPMALTSAGEIVVNAGEFAVKVSLDLAIENAKRSGLPIFVGVVVPRAEVSKAMKNIDDAAADLAGHLGGGVQRRISRSRRARGRT